MSKILDAEDIKVIVVGIVMVLLIGLFLILLAGVLGIAAGLAVAVFEEVRGF